LPLLRQNGSPGVGLIRNLDDIRAVVSLDESIQMEMEAHRLIQDLPGVRNIVSRLGRGEFRSIPPATTKPT